ncbi:MAG: hypothetical protein P8171_26130 [Candidatus Thiodiazotropha sp.]
MLKKYIGIALLVIASGCDAGNKAQDAGAEQEKSSFHIVKMDKQLQDPASPVGYWEVSLTYPQLINGAAASLDVVNKRIRKLVDDYSCQGMGDQTFTADPVYSNGRVLGFYYEAMWMCPTMPSPDSTSGVVNYNLKTGGTIDIRKEFIDEASLKRFVALANEALNKKLEGLPASEKAYCAPFDETASLFVAQDGIVVKGLSASGEEPDCPVSITIHKKELAAFVKTGSVILE